MLTRAAMSLALFRALSDFRIGSFNWGRLTRATLKRFAGVLRAISAIFLQVFPFARLVDIAIVCNHFAINLTDPQTGSGRRANGYFIIVIVVAFLSI